MKLGVIAGNRFLPQLLLKNIKEKNKTIQTVAICLRGETSPAVAKCSDKSYWINPVSLSQLRSVIEKEGLTEMVMAGQISPVRIFKTKQWDDELKRLVENTADFRPHEIFGKIINYFQARGVRFVDSTIYLKDFLASPGLMNGIELKEETKRDIDFGIKIISGYAELDVGQTVAVKTRSVVALESFEGTDRAISRAWRLAGRSCVILKFAKKNQDLRFDVPVVGLSTLNLLKRIKASALVLEKDKVIMLDKNKFLSLAKIYNIPVIGKERPASD